MARTGRTIWQSIVSPVLSNSSLYFFVVSEPPSAPASRRSRGVGKWRFPFIVPGLIMLMPSRRIR